MPLTTLADAEHRKDGFSQARKADFLVAFDRLHCDVDAAAQAVGISRTTAFDHMEADAAFGGRVARIKQGKAWSLTPILYRRAIEKSDTAAIWLQKVLDPRHFNIEHPSLGLTAFGPLTITFSTAPPLRPVVADASATTKHMSNGDSSTLRTPVATVIDVPSSHATDGDGIRSDGDAPAQKRVSDSST